MAKLQHKLDPAIWSKTPYDVILVIIKHSDLTTQTNWSCTSREFFPVASSSIWSSLLIHSSEITAYPLILSGQRATDNADSVVHFLLESAYRRHDKWSHVVASDGTLGVFVYQPNGVEKCNHPKEITATLPISRVRELGIDNQGFDDQHPVCHPFDMDLVLRTLLRRIPALQSFKYVGPLSAKNLKAIIQINGLRTLQVRNGSDVLEVPTTQTRTHALPWMDYPLDWSVLSNLKGLQALEVGRVLRFEARGLAEGVAFLNLRRLHISCWGWEYGTNQLVRSVRFNVYMSALVMFLDDLTKLHPRDGQTSGGFPSTLKDLVLVDKYHSHIPSLHQLIATAILPCENLESLTTTICVDGRCHNIINKMGLPAYHKIVGVGSWQQLSCDEGIKVLHRYQSPSEEILQTDPYPKALSNIVKTLDQVIAAAESPGYYRMSMKFVKDRQFRNDEILVYPYKGGDDASAAELGPQVLDAPMMNLAARFASLSLERTIFAHAYPFPSIRAER